MREEGQQEAAANYSESGEEVGRRRRAGFKGIFCTFAILKHNLPYISALIIQGFHHN